MGVVINPKMDAILTTLGKIKDDIKGLGFAAKGSGDIVSFPDSIGGFNVNRITADLEPVQDLHGQDAPYPAGGGKNKLPLTVDGIKAASTGGTWSGNAYTINGITYTILIDSANNITGIRANGTATADAPLVMARNITLANGSYALNGCPSGGSSTKYYLYTLGVVSNDYGSGASLTISGQALTFALLVKSGTAVSNITFYPMIRLASITDATFAPYTNICPISGHTEVETTGTGKNLCPMFKTETKNGATIAVDSNGVVTPSGTATAQVSFYQEFVMNAGTYFLSGAPSGATSGDYDIYVSDMDAGVVIARCFDSAAQATRTFTITKPTNVRVNIRVNAGALVSSKKFYPQIERGTTATTYAPYIGTSVLTEIGINQWDEEWEQGAISGADGSLLTATNAIRSKNYNSCVGGETFYLNIAGASSVYYLHILYYDASKTFISHEWKANGTSTAPSNARFFKIATNTSSYVYGGTYNNDISINFPARFTGYYPYTGIGAVYGGTLDVTSGKLTATMRVLSPAGLVAANISTVQTVGSLTRFWLYIANKTTGDVRCDRAATSNGSTYGQEIVELYGADSNYPQSIWMKLPTVLVGTTVASVLTYLQTSGIQIAYTLVTPIVYQLEPQAVQTVLGQNNIYTDSGEVNVWYVAGLS